jgi:ligand-binding sensor domain-containing protein
MVRARISDCCFLILALLFLCTAVSADTGNQTLSVQARHNIFDEIRVFNPGTGSIHSAQVNDATNGKNGTTVFATRYGLSFYNGSWNTRHVTRDNVSEGLMDDFITALQFDRDGNLWIGYAGGLQIYDGHIYRTIRDQQLLKELQILALQRWGDSMWIATGTSGIHRYLYGNWTWFQPMSSDGPGFYEIDSMVLDPRTDALLIATVHDGIWKISSQSDPVAFLQIEAGSRPEVIWHVRKDPFGGAYFFNSQNIRRYTPEGTWENVLATKDLTLQQISISDISAGSDGTLYIATDNGIYAWKNGRVLQQIGRYEGIGTSHIVRFVFADAKDRIWFSTQDDVGYFHVPSSLQPAVTIQILNQSGEPEVTATISVATPVPVTSMVTYSSGQGTEENKKELSLIERLTEFLNGFFG